MNHVSRPEGNRMKSLFASAAMLVGLTVPLYAAAPAPATQPRDTTAPHVS